MTLIKEKPSLWENTRNNLKKWERVRASIENNRSKEFISKIFKPGQNEVKEDINWWQELWHKTFTKKNVKLSMEHLGDITLNGIDNALLKGDATAVTLSFSLGAAIGVAIVNNKIGSTVNTRIDGGRVDARYRLQS